MHNGHIKTYTHKGVPEQKIGAGQCGPPLGGVFIEVVLLRLRLLSWVRASKLRGAAKPGTVCFGRLGGWTGHSASAATCTRGGTPVGSAYHCAVHHWTAGVAQGPA